MPDVAAVRRRRVVAGAATAAVAVAGAWGVLGPRDHGGAEAAGVGETVEVDSGHFRVEEVSTRELGQVMAGMSMPQDVPEGMKRFTVVFTIDGGDSGIDYPATAFRIEGVDEKFSLPIAHMLGSERVPAGSAANGRLVFQVPEDADDLVLHFERADRPIALGSLQDGHGDNDHGH